VAHSTKSPLVSTAGYQCRLYADAGLVGAQIQTGVNDTAANLLAAIERGEEEISPSTVRLGSMLRRCVRGVAALELMLHLA
jgi:hypothetical protein